MLECPREASIYIYIVLLMISRDPKPIVATSRLNEHVQVGGRVLWVGSPEADLQGCESGLPFLSRFRA